MSLNILLCSIKCNTDMAENRSKQRNSSYGRSDKSDDVLKNFADMMIEIIKKADAGNWKKGWLGVSGSIRGLPQNISGRTYSGGNSFFLMADVAEKGYKTPVYMTFRQANEQGLHVKAGEKSVPIPKWSLSIKDENGNKIPEEDYRQMSQEEQAKLTVRPFLRMFHVFNVDQTNLAEANKQKYDAMVARFQAPKEDVKDTQGMYVNESLDKMFQEKAWYAKIQYDKPSDRAFFRPSEDLIVLPMKEQFKKGTTPEEVYRDGMEYYSTALHEMAHSTGHESRLNRTFGHAGTKEYAHEELIAEMTSALVGSTMGFDRKILDNNAQYLNGWLGNLRRNPETIVSIMSDVGKASDMIIEKIDEQRVAMNQTPLKAGNLAGLDEELSETKKKGKTLSDLQAQYSQINGQYPVSVDDNRTRQIAKRIRQAEQIITTYNSNISAAYGDDFLLSEKAMTTVIPHAVYSGREQPTLESQGQAVASEPENQNIEDTTGDVTLSEDSNPETNVAGVAENIMGKGNVSKAVAERQAAAIVEDQQSAIEEKKQKAEQAKQAALKKAEDERRREVEEQRRKEEENRQQEKDGGHTSKLLLHAALLLGALELAKGNKGVWMNKAGKSNAEFVGAKRPIMAYNNIMMNLQSDQKGYRSNLYTSFDNAKESGTPVKQNEDSLGFNWVKWDYQHVGTKDVISKADYDQLPAEEKEFYTTHRVRETHDIFNIDQTTMPAAKHSDYNALLREKGAKYETLSDKGVSNMMDFAEKLKRNHPTAIVLARTDNQFQVYGKDAAKAGKALGLPVGQIVVDGEKTKTVSFPQDRLDNYLPKLVQARHWVVVADNLDSAELIRQLPDEKEVLNKAYSTAQAVAKSAGIGYERVMVLQDAEYDKQKDKITVSGLTDRESGSSRQAAIEKANDIYRAVVAATGGEQRLDRMGRNNLLPKDDATYERFVQDLASGVLMARQGLPATLSKESMERIDYLQREIRENPQLLGLLEKDVNNAVESIDKHLQKQAVKYEEIRNELTPKDLTMNPRQYKISTDLSKIPDMESKEIVIVRDKAKGAAAVILPEGASLEDDVEIPGIRKDRIKTALGKEGFTDVRFYNAGGGLGLNEPNDYYKDKTVSVGRLKQYNFAQHRDVDVRPQIAAAEMPKLKLFVPIKDDKGQYAFFFKPEDEPSFAIYPNDAHKKLYFDVRGKDNQQEIHNALAQKYYAVAQQHPEVKIDLIMPKTPDVDMSKIERPTITKDRENPNKKYVMATIDGQLIKKEISKAQWDKMWLADDMVAYKKAVAAVMFAPLLRGNVNESDSVQQQEQGAEPQKQTREEARGESDETSETTSDRQEQTPRKSNVSRRP